MINLADQIDLIIPKPETPPISNFDTPTFRYFCEHLNKKLSFKAEYGHSTLSNMQDSRDFDNIWPPHIINSYRSGMLVPFLGAGISAGSDLPTWRKLLETKLKLRDEFLSDENLKTDNLTLGEISARLYGREALQHSLREIYNSPDAKTTTTHIALCLLKLNFYITTNYDCLLEKAWDTLYPLNKLGSRLITSRR